MRVERRTLILLLLAAVALVLLLAFLSPAPNPVNAIRYGVGCRIERTCGPLVGIDCMAAIDGPYFYVDAKTGGIVSRCGGYCDSPQGCANCPPKGWTCKTY